MKALWLENRQIAMREIQIPADEQEALIRIRLAGICGTDLELVKGYYPFTGVPGHEFVGEVCALPRALDKAGDEKWLGKRVTGVINVSCQKCEQCLNGRESHCEKRSVLGIMNRNGVFAEYCQLPLRNLVEVPDSIPDEAAVFTEPLAAALEINQQVQIHPTDRVLLIGAGRLGLLIAQTLKLSGANLRVAARHDQQKKILKKVGIEPIEAEDIQPKRWDVVVEATGSSAGFETARKAIRPRGTIVLKSTYAGQLTTDMSSIVVDEITLLGSRCGPFRPALNLLQQKLIETEALIGAEFPLSDAIKAFESAAQKGMLKVLLRP